MTAQATAAVLLLALASVSNADIVVENDLIKPQEIYNFTYSTDSDVWWRTVNTTRYYCVFRNHWTSKNHPNGYPRNARWSDILLYSSNKEYRPWLLNRETTLGVQKIAETGFTDVFVSEMKSAGDLVYTWAQADGFFVDQEHWSENYVYIPPVDVSFDFPYLNGIVGISPSPDWFSGFYLFDTVDEFDRTFWNNFTLFTFPWDAGTDGGESYTAEDAHLDPKDNVKRFYPNNMPDSKPFMSADGKSVPPVAELTCELYVCPAENPKCVRPNWPPKNYCDVFKYPKCATYCDPNKDEGCEECKGNGYEAKSVYLFGCCENGHDPRYGSCTANSGAAASFRSSGVSALTTALLVAGLAAAWR